MMANNNVIVEVRGLEEIKQEIEALHDRIEKLREALQTIIDGYGDVIAYGALIADDEAEKESKDSCTI